MTPDFMTILYLHLDRKIGARELDCVALVHGMGCTQREASRRMGISLMQVQRALKNVVSKSRPSLANQA
jgi:predicted DNA-binding protein (UPF0251 family)